jgi:MFS family permease
LNVPESLAPLRERQFVRVFTAHTISNLGDFFVPVAIAFAVLNVTKSASDLGIVLAAQFVPMVLFVQFGGVWADRLPRQLVMVASDLVRAASQGTLALLLLTGHARLWEFVVLQALHGAASGFFNPAFTGLMPQVVSAERLQQANALRFLSTSFTSILGPLFAGAIVAGIGAGWAIAVDAASFVLSAAFLVQVRLPKAEARERKPLFAEAGEGFRELRSRAWLWVTVVDASLFQFLVLSGYFVLGPLVSKQSLGGATAWAVILAGWGVGSLVGGLLALRFRPSRPLLVGHVGILAAAPSIVLLGLRAPAFLVALASLGAGASTAFADTALETTVQQNVPQHVLSRVSAWDWMGSFALRPLGFALVAPVADAIGIRKTLIGAAIAMALVEIVSVASVPALRGRPPYAGAASTSDADEPAVAPAEAKVTP